MDAQEVFEYYLCHIRNLTIHGDTIMVTWMLMGIFIVLALILHKKLSTVPGHFQNILEMAVLYFNDLAVSMGGEKAKKYASYIMGIFFFVLSCNWLGLFPSFIKAGHVQLSMPPTRDISTTVALALISFFSFHFFGFRAKGIRYLLHYIHPIPELVRTLPRNLLIIIPPLFVLFVFLNIVEELARVLSLSVRLMGNILGEHVVASSLLGFFIIVLQLIKIFAIPVDLLPLFILFLGLLTGAIQAFIFSVLTLSYITHAVEEDH
jgi:F-type H+-transporting ATPase subunit a